MYVCLSVKDDDDDDVLSIMVKMQNIAKAKVLIIFVLFLWIIWVNVS